MTFNPVPKEFDVPAVEHEVIDYWREHDVVRLYLDRNNASAQRFSFIDGPITANGPMGVHHAWGRTYKDLWQRYNTMLGKKQRYQNGFDWQGLWVEVTVEKELGFTSKHDIERYGIAEFVRKCKESVYSFAALQTEQSERLGYFMDWDNSYYTLSDENNYTIWYFLKTCHEKGLLYRGTDVMPWCTRCGTGLSEHEIATDGYQELTHRSVYVRFPVAGRPGEYLLVWTTTPWTLTSNVAVAVNPKLVYVKVRQDENYYYLARGAAQSALRGEYEVVEELPGSALLGWSYEGPYDELPAQAKVRHTVIPWDEVSEVEGTGLVHIAPGAGKEDFALGKEFELSVLAPIDQNGIYGEDFGPFAGRNVHDVAGDIIADLHNKGLLYRAQDYQHRYPTCWRCGTELVFRLVDEWFISMDPLREPMMEVVRNITWLPDFGLDRELDWLRNMDDWMISKKRYWGLALPFWICPNDHLQVIGGKEELFEQAIGGVQYLESPHRPWVDEITIACPECGQVAHRIPDVGNPWLDAGIVPYSTLHYRSDPEYWREWFPADFITESFPGQFRNWFYSMLAMSTVLEDTEPFETVLGYALLRDQNGREMHKSWGNAIPFDEAADRAGADVMRWLFVQHNPEVNLNFGYASLDEVKRRLLVLWNTYSFFVTYANLDGWTPAASAGLDGQRPLLDAWLLARLNRLVQEVRAGLDAYDSMGPSRAIDAFIEELSTWYVRRSRRRFWKAEDDGDKRSAYDTLYTSLTTLTRLIAPFMPHLAEYLYRNLVRSVSPDAAVSVHLTDYPDADESIIDEHLLRAMDLAQEIVALGRAARDRANQKVRQPLATMYVRVPTAADADDVRMLQDIILDELNVKALAFVGEGDTFVSYTVRPNLPALGPRYGKLLPRIRQALDVADASDLARAVERGETVHLPVDGQVIELSPSDLLVSAQEREGYAAMSSDRQLVALDTRLTRELVHEGWAREVVRRVNDWRRSAGFNIDDRIVIRYTSSPELGEAIIDFRDYIAMETLAIRIEQGTPSSDGFRGEATFGDQVLQMELERAPRPSVVS